MSLHIVITAGGTREPIDEVRCITNSSTGALGLRIANEFLRRQPDCKITYICGKGTLAPADNRVNKVVIGSVADLVSAIENVTPAPDIFVHSMAVSDYTVDCVFDRETGAQYPTGGKISSNIQQPCIALKPTPKVIGMIKKKWPHVFLVGFKLLTHVSEEELFQTAFKLLRKNRCNLVLANDLSKIRNGTHVGMIIFPEKTQKTYYGKEQIALSLVDTILARQSVRHHISIQDSEIEGKNEKERVFPFFKATGKRLADRLFLPEVPVYDRDEPIGTYGNMSVRIDEDRFVITGRNVNKGDLNEKDLVLINRYESCSSEDSVVGKVHYSGCIKPSIDAAIHYRIYKLRPEVKAILHIHTNLSFEGIPTTDYNYPCGCYEEANALAMLVDGDHSAEIYQMVDHGLLILGDSLEDCENKLYAIVRSSSVSSRLYLHATFRKYLSSIKEKGLIGGYQKNYSFSGERIYLIDSKKVSDPAELAVSFCEAAELTDLDTYNSGVVVLSIREEDLPSIPEIDPNVHDGENEITGYSVTVSGTIPPSKLSFYMEQDL